MDYELYCAVDGSESFVFAEQRVTSWTCVMSVFEAVDEERQQTTAQSAPANTPTRDATINRL